MITILVKAKWSILSINMFGSLENSAFNACTSTSIRLYLMSAARSFSKDNVNSKRANHS